MPYLIVDDSKMARRMTAKSLKEVLNDDKAEIIEAENGKTAVELYKSTSPKICLMDLTMPELDGFTATQQICQYDKDAKVIIVSADIQEKSIEKARENGALGFIKKPINKVNLESMLKSLGLL